MPMRGNRYVRGGDPLKSQAQRKRDKAERISKSKWGKRRTSKIREVKERQTKKQTNSHTAVLMESFVVRRKAVRKAMKVEQASRAASSARSTAGSTAGSEARTDTTAPPRRPVRRTAPVSRALY
jgi:hypothetical protein